MGRTGQGRQAQRFGHLEAIPEKTISFPQGCSKDAVRLGEQGRDHSSPIYARRKAQAA